MKDLIVQTIANSKDKLSKHDLIVLMIDKDVTYNSANVGENIDQLIKDEKIELDSSNHLHLCTKRAWRVGVTEYEQGWGQRFLGYKYYLEKPDLPYQTGTYDYFFLNSEPELVTISTERYEKFRSV